MHASTERTLIPIAEYDLLREGRAIVRREAQALEQVAQRLDAAFCVAAELLLQCRGCVVVCGMGKAGLIGQKIAATLSSTGTRSWFLHPAEAVHGDLGALHSDDVFLALSNSGETAELLELLPALRRLGIPTVAVTSTKQNSLAAHATVAVEMGRLQEACPWGLAPTTSTAAMLAIGDALALVVSRQRGFTPKDFAERHPAGSLGRKLKPVSEVMRPRDQLRIARSTDTVRDVFIRPTPPGRRSGAVLLVDADGVLEGLFTDSDLARLLARGQEAGLDRPIGDVMTRQPLTVSTTATLADVIDTLSDRKISELPVVDGRGRLQGLIDITDIIGWTPDNSDSAAASA
ncbi:MAG: SIS domain-containing protein [Planctomycetaceae bacterium]